MDRSRRVLAWALIVLVAVQTLLAVGGAVILRLPMADLVASYLLTNTAIGVGFGACGAILAVQRPANAIGWLLLGAGIAPLMTAAVSPFLAYGALHDWHDPVMRTLLTVFTFAWPWGIAMFVPLALQIFPTGRAVSPRWRWLLAATVGAGALFAAHGVVDPEPMIIYGRAFQPYLWVPLSVMPEPLWSATNVAPLLALIGAIAALVVRYRRGDEHLRRQLLWLVLAVIVAVGLTLPRWMIGDGPVLLLLAIPLVPLAITVAILHYQLLDIRLVLSRTVLYLLLTVAVAGAYIGTVTVFDVVLRGTGAPVLAALLIALAFNPARIRLQRGVDRLLYGARADPIQAVSSVGARLAADDLAGVLDGARASLRLPFVAVRRDGHELAAVGHPPTTVQELRLVLRGIPVGELIVGVRRGEARLAPADLAVLNLLAAPLAAAVSAAALADDVQAARERLVAAREEERRRLHRDLHDGLGPALTGIGFKADAAKNLVTASPEQATARLMELRGDIQDAIENVRRLVYGLRPPALDELGLTAALQRHCAALPLTVTIDAPPALPALPAAVEVAAYRIATEALTNIARHARAGLARVTLAVDSALRLSIMDNGAASTPWVPGVGLTSIRERASELGGTCTAGPTPAGGRVDAVLPLAVGT